jgi:hypothetical protein
MTKFLTDEKYVQIQQYLRRLSTACQWFNPEIDHDYIKMVWSVMSRLNENNQSITWEKIIKNYRERYLPSEKYLKEMVGMLINDVLAATHKDPYKTPTEEERAEAAQAATEARENFDKMFTMLYEDDETLLKNKAEEERKTNVKTHREKHMQMVKSGMVELTTPETLPQRTANGPIWIKKSEAIAQGLSEVNGDFKCHRERYVNEVNSFGRIGR